MKLLDILDSKKKRSIARTALLSEGLISVNDIARRTKSSRSFVSEFCGLLSKQGILRARNGKYALHQGTAVDRLRLITNISELPPEAYFARYANVEAVGIYGSWVKGSNTAHSDADIWIKTKTRDLGRTLKLSGALKKKLGDVNILYLTPAKLKALKERDPVFYHSLVFGSLILYGN
ncbi:MAG: hypothetical protein QME74_02850, partial [Candidatus Edwardsbacteria bacterium]|nr:hypothetical protein [Candidatus Edwardsbacteria bacterium]